MDKPHPEDIWSNVVADLLLELAAAYLGREIEPTEDMRDVVNEIRMKRLHHV